MPRLLSANNGESVLLCYRSIKTRTFRVHRKLSRRLLEIFHAFKITHISSNCCQEFNPTIKVCLPQKVVDRKLHTVDNSRSGVVYNFSCVCVCNTITFESLDVGGTFFAHPVYLEGTGSSSKGHRVTVKVTGTTKVENSYFSSKTSIGNNSGAIKRRAVKFVCSMGFEWCDRQLCHVTGSDHV